MSSDASSPTTRPNGAPKRQPGPGQPASAAPPVPGLPPIEFPADLPVSARRDEIEAALRQHQVIIVCGETGSGKTTQLPKIALHLGRGQGRVRGQRQRIGHTQPRRIAASSVAQRIADELKTPLGEVVGYKVRFHDRLQPGASIKLMTDGILLAETQSDPDLLAYDTLIIDEAHERSLNIDFLLGYLRQLLPRRPDLKLIITSATIDAERFARHFAGRHGPAPVVMVSGRLYPVEQRWRAFEESRDHGLHDAVADAVDELWHEGSGDILVFLPGEREIREATDHLRRHLAQRHQPADILPLFARLSQAEQQRVFKPGGLRRIVLATNVAETSLTVPGIRYVIDTGLARVKRYSFRNKVEQLQIEPISQAAANQRAGRCGRVANGICIRLYDEKDFAGRPRFTDPEILRSSLAGVILRMKSLHLGAVEEFPFIEPPRPKAIADGYQLLGELGAVDEANEITALGHQLARLPLDPRVGRMILEARDRQALSEVLVIAASLSVQDVRDRPLEQAAAADEKHKKFDDEKSEFMGVLKLWRWLHQAQGGAHTALPGTVPAPQPGPGGGAEAPAHKLSHRKYEQLLREHFISPRRVREWRDVHTQLHTVVAEQQWRLNGAPATYEQIHCSLLAGLLGNVGCKSDEDEWYLGARGIKFWRHPGAHLSKRPGRWILAAELVETTRLYGRGIASIEPTWLVSVGAHLLKKQLLDPHWEKKAGEVVAMERATLYGLVVYNNKRVNFGNVDPVAAREIFIRQALVAMDWDSRLAFWTHNRKTIAQVEQLEHKSRRQDVLVDEELIYEFYDRQLPPEVVSAATLERWYGPASRAEPKLLLLTREELMRHEAAGVTSEAFPRTIRLGGVDCTVNYLHEPGHPRDGVTVTLPLFALNQADEDRAQWLVPGMLADKVMALLKSLPQKPRARLVPLPAFAESFIAGTPFGQGALLATLLGAVRERTQLDVKAADFKLEQLAPHLLMNFCVVDEQGRQLAMGRHLPALKAELSHQARGAFQALAALKLGARGDGAVAAAAATDPRVAAAPQLQPVVQARRQPAAQPVEARAAAGATPTGPFTQWSFDELPEIMEIKKGGHTLIGFPALVDGGDHVDLEVFDEPEVAARKHREGLRRLVALQIREPLRYLEKNLPDAQKLTMLYMSLGTAQELVQQIVEVTLDRAFLLEPLPRNAAEFAARVEQGRPRLNLIAQEVSRLALSVLTEYAAAQRKLKDARAAKEVAEDITQQLARLCAKHFLARTPYAQLQHFPRYLKGVVLRLDKWRADPTRDAQRLAEIRPLEQRYARRVAELKGARDTRLEEFRWLLEELRVSLFAQELRTPQPVSVKRLEKVWSAMAQ